MKELQKLVNIWQRYKQEYGGTFQTHSVHALSHLNPSIATA